MREGIEGEGHRLERATESTLAKFGGRVLVPMLLTAVIVLAGALLNTLNIKLDGVIAAQKLQAEEFGQMKSDIRDISTRFDVQVLRQLDTNTKRLDKLEDRMQTVERQVQP